MVTYIVRTGFSVTNYGNKCILPKDVYPNLHYNR